MPSPVIITPAQLAKLAPRCLPVYSDSFAQGGVLLARCGVSASARRMAHFMAQILHESGGLTLQVENLRYGAARLGQVWPARFQPRGPLDPATYADNEELLADAVYGGRMGNTLPGDGYKYRGRGLLQLTGKASYAHASCLLRQRCPDAPDFTLDPDAVLAPAWCLGIAAAQWEARGCNQAADRDDLALVTRRINGGAVGLEARRVWLLRTRALWSTRLR